MALSNQALALIFISTLLLSTFAVAENRAESPAPAPAPVPAPTPYTSGETHIPVPTNSPQTSAAWKHPVKTNSPQTSAAWKQLVKTIGHNNKATNDLIQDFEKQIEKRLNNHKTSSTTKECFKKCTGIFKAAVEDNLKSDEHLKSGDLNQARFYISSVSTKVESCKCIEKKLAKALKLKKLSHEVREINVESIRLINKYAFASQ